MINLHFRFVSDTHFKELQKTIENVANKVMDSEKSEIIFKEKLIETLERKFTTHWTEAEIESNLLYLEIAKARNKDGSKKWRPTDKPVDEQSNPAVIDALVRKRNVLLAQVEFQNRALETLVPQVEQQRQLLKNQAAQRQAVVARIKGDKVELERINEKIDETHNMLSNNL